MSSKKSKVTRRNFLQASAGVAASAAALSMLKSTNAQASPAPELDTRPLKLGIVGTGWQGKVLMREGIKNPGVEFTAVCDIVPARVKEAKEIAPGAKEYEDYKKLIADGKNGLFQALVVGTPLHMHHPIVMEALNAGLDVFCEKCIARTIDEAKEMVTASISGNRVLQVGHHLRYHPIYHIAKKKFIDVQALGKINNIHCQWNRNGSWRRTPPPGTYDFGAWGYENPDELFNWRLYKKFSGGLMTELASHQLDVVNWILNDPVPEAINGVGRTDRDDGRTIFDNVHLIYEYPDNVQVTYQSITTNAYNPYGWEAYEMIQGDKGTLIMVHLAPKYIGLYFLEPDVPEALWMPLASKADFDTGNLRRKEYKTAIVMGHPTGEDRISGLKLEALVTEDNLPKVSTYQLEIHDFRNAVLDRKKPFCDGMIGLKSAIPAIRGNDAMEKQTRLEIPESDYTLG